MYRVEWLLNDDTCIKSGFKTSEEAHEWIRKHHFKKFAFPMVFYDGEQKCVFHLEDWRKTIMVEMNKEMQKCFDEIDDKQKIRMFYELTKYMCKNMEYGDDKNMNNLLEDIFNVKNDIENL